jgi:hypothetical protein
MVERSPDPAGPGHGDEMDQGEVLRQLAEDKIVATGGRRLGPELYAAASLLADLYTVGLTHGITPQEWAWVTDLPDACWHASRDAAARQERARDRAQNLTESRTVAPPPEPGLPRDRPYLAPGRSLGSPPPAPGRPGRSR